MADFGLIKSFGIDHGELDGIRPQQCFVLGYELALIDNLLAGDDEIVRPVNAENRERVQAACKEAGREYRIQWMPGDQSESWLLLEVPRRSKE